MRTTIKAAMVSNDTISASTQARSTRGVIQSRLRKFGLTSPSAYTPVAPPPPPVTVTIPVCTSITSTTIELQLIFFIPTGVNVISKKMEYSLNSAFSGTLSTAFVGTSSITSVVSLTGTTYTYYANASGLTPGTTYYFRGSVNVGGSDIQSDVAIIPTSAAAPPPAAIYTVAIVGSPTANTIKIRTTFFVPSLSNLTGQNVQYTSSAALTGQASMSPSGPLNSVIVTGGTSYMFDSIVTTLSPGTTYYFQAVITVDGGAIRSVPVVFYTTTPNLLIAGIEPMGPSYSYDSVLTVSSYTSDGSTGTCDSCDAVYLKGSASTGNQGFAPTNIGTAIRMRVYFKDYPTFTSATINAVLMRDSGSAGATATMQVGSPIHCQIASTDLILAGPLHYVDIPISSWPFSVGTTYYVFLMVSDADGPPPGPNWTIACKSSSSAYKSTAYGPGNNKCTQADIGNNTLFPKTNQDNTPYIALYNY